MLRTDGDAGNNETAVNKFAPMEQIKNVNSLNPTVVSSVQLPVLHVVT